jgi:CDP-diacylglycerol--glycerol-3-phosphate 3-phosphatidyltransferase
MGLQCAVLIGVLLIEWWRATERSATVLGVLEPVQRVLLWAMLLATIGSGLQYLVKAARLLR